MKDTLKNTSAHTASPTLPPVKLSRSFAVVSKAQQRVLLAVTFVAGMSVGVACTTVVGAEKCARLSLERDAAFNEGYATKNAEYDEALREAIEAVREAREMEMRRRDVDKQLAARGL